MKRLLIVSHCILNTASKVAMDEKELQEEYELRRTLRTKVMEDDIQLLQLPGIHPVWLKKMGTRKRSV